jgi:TetR/AcrR family transcriptional regulator, regulator of autoinduction and epiphytic fitness
MTSTQAAPQLPEQSPDGRLARSARTRELIVDAVRSLHHDGDLRPTAARVAGRAGVSLRTVWQHFADLETLLVTAGRRDFEIASSYMAPIDEGQPVAARVTQLVQQRIRLFEGVSPVWRAARLQAPFSPQIRLNRDRLFAVARAQLAQVFGPELDALPVARRQTTLHALQVATSWSTWESLRTELGLTRAAAQQVVLTLTSNVLAIP